MRLYFRCNGGHYFTGQNFCPFDGWTTSGVEGVRDAFEKLRLQGPVTIEALRSHVVPPELLQRTVIIDIGDDAAAFDALAPEYYFLRGKMVPIFEVPLELY